MKPVTVGPRIALVDDNDLDLVLPYTWSIAKRGSTSYAQTNVKKEDGARTILLMHRLILGNPSGRVDHRDHNGLNNQRENLRVTDGSGNAANQLPRGGTSQFKGVCWAKRYSRWVAYIKVKGKRIHLGTFTDEVKAAQAYDVAAREHFGEFALLNFKDAS